MDLKSPLLAVVLRPSNGSQKSLNLSRNMVSVMSEYTHKVCTHIGNLEGKNSCDVNPTSQKGSKGL